MKTFHFSIQNNVCPFGDKCRFFHDVAEYMASKPADIGESCHLYDTFGKCSYGVSCRFANAHTTPDFKTMENKDLVAAWENRATVRNSLNKELQTRLRKRSEPFTKSVEYLKMLSKYKDKKEQNRNGKSLTGVGILDGIFLCRNFLSIFLFNVLFGKIQVSLAQLQCQRIQQMNSSMSLQKQIHRQRKL